MKRRIKYRCGAPKVDGGICGQPVAAAGQRCRDHPHGKPQSKALRKAVAESWNTQGRRQAPASKVGQHAEQSLLRRILSGELVFKWMSPKMIKTKGRIMAPVDAAAREIPYRRNRGAGRAKVKTPHSPIWWRQISRED